MQVRVPGLLALAGSLALTAAGCPKSELAPLEPCTVSGVVREVQQTAIDKVDLLFVVDNSGSMAAEQGSLARELPRMVQILASGDLDQDGTADFPPVSNMHLGVISTDMGAAGQDGVPGQEGDPRFDSQGCANPGDDGRLLFPQQCSGKSPNGNFMVFGENDDPAVLGQNFGCVVQLGTDGCGQEQQLDAMLKALTADPSITFFGGTTGHRNMANSGFLRDDAVLAVIMVTDEDDCSLPDQNAELLAFSGGAYANEAINLRCGNHPELLHPPERYVEGLRNLKPANPELVIFAAITGINTSLQGQPADVILADPTMEFRSDSDDPNDLRALPRPSCQNQDDPTQQAYPPRRIVQVAAGFGTNGTVQSICQNDFSGALDNIVRKISEQLKGGCLPRSLVVTAEGLVPCDIVELIPDPEFVGDAKCNTAGRAPLRTQTFTDGDGVETNYQVCKINQVPVMDGQLGVNPETGLGVGWYYDDFSEDTMENCKDEDTAQRITFTSDANPPTGATVRFECLQPVLDFGQDPVGKAIVGRSCVDEEQAICQQRTCTEDIPMTGGCDKPYDVICHQASNTCQLTCANQSHCPNGWQCATGLLETNDERNGLCILPTCPALEI